MNNIKEIKSLKKKISTANELIESNNVQIDDCQKKIKVLWDEVKDMTLGATKTDAITEEIRGINTKVKEFKSSTKRTQTRLLILNDKLRLAQY